MHDFSWKNLQRSLAESPYLEAADNINTQRGLVAAAAAIVDRMSNSERMREVTWTPERKWARKLEWSTPVLIEITPPRRVPEPIAVLAAELVF